MLASRGRAVGLCVVVRCKAAARDLLLEDLLLEAFIARSKAPQAPATSALRLANRQSQYPKIKQRDTFGAVHTNTYIFESPPEPTPSGAKKGFRSGSPRDERFSTPPFDARYSGVVVSCVLRKPNKRTSKDAPMRRITAEFHDRADFNKFDLLILIAYQRLPTKGCFRAVLFHIKQCLFAVQTQYF